MTTYRFCDDDIRKMDYLADALTPAEKVAVEHHLEGCESCRLELGDMALLADGLGELSRPHCPEALSQTALAALEQSCELEGRFHRDHRVVLLFLVGVVAALFALLILGNHPGLSGDEPAAVQSGQFHSMRFVLVGFLLLALPAGLDNLGFLVVRRRLMSI